MVDNITDNLSRWTNNYRYSDHLRQFAYSLFILSGQNAYEFVRLYIPSLLPSRTTIKAALNKSSNRMYDGHFYFDSMANHFSSTGSTFAFAAEDCTGVIIKVTYDSSSNSFVGFATPMRNIHPQAAHFQTDSYHELETWFVEMRKSSLPMESTAPLLRTIFSPVGVGFMIKG